MPVELLNLYKIDVKSREARFAGLSLSSRAKLRLAGLGRLGLDYRAYTSYRTYRPIGLSR
jgi:hypothetical protein